MSLDAGDLQAFGCAEGSPGTKAWKYFVLEITVSDSCLPSCVNFL